MDAGDSFDDEVAVETKSTKGTDKARFYVSKGNNWELVAGHLEDKGWERLPFESSSVR